MTLPAATCCWLVDQDERTMIDAFFQVNADESSDTPDIFLRFETPFADSRGYGRALAEELSQMVDADREDLAEDDIYLDWRSGYDESADNLALGFLRDFFHFADSLELDDSKVIAFLSPSVISKPDGWQRWWKDALALPIPEKIRLMVCEVKGQEHLRDLIKAHPESLALLEANLDMTNAIRELMSEYGDQEDACTHFRKAFYELTQAVGQQDAELIQARARTAVALAREIGFPHLEIAVLCVTGNGFMQTGKTNAGITAFDEAIRVAEAAKDKPLLAEMPDLKIDLPGGNLFDQLAVQALFFKAAGFLSLKKPDFAAALEVYQTAGQRLTGMLPLPEDQVDWATGGIIHFHRAEALRMTAFCHEKLRRNVEALKRYQQYIEQVALLPDEIRQGTMLPFAGQAALKICQQSGKKEEYWQIQQKMNNLLGERWQELLPVS